MTQKLTTNTYEHEHEHEYDFCQDITRLIEAGATLRMLFDAMLSVRNTDMRVMDTSPSRLRQMAESWSLSRDFLLIRLNEMFNGLEVEHSDDYVLAMVGGLNEVTRIFMLRHDDELREEVFWRVFEVEGGGEISLTNIDKFSPETGNWYNTVIQLADEGILERHRILRGCLEALNRDFSAYRAGWFSRLYTALEPTPEEAAVDQDLLRLCLGSSVSAVVSLGAKQLAAVHKVEQLDAMAFAKDCGGAFSGTKAAAVTVIRILDSLAAKSSVDIDVVAQGLTVALGHPHADVQRAAAKSLIKFGKEERALAQRDLLSPLVAAELLPILKLVAPQDRNNVIVEMVCANNKALRPPEPLKP